MFLWFIVRCVVCVVGIMCWLVFCLSCISVLVWMVLIFGMIRCGCFWVISVCSVIVLSMLIICV